MIRSCIFVPGHLLVVLVISVCIYVAGLIKADSFLPHGSVEFAVLFFMYCCLGRGLHTPLVHPPPPPQLNQTNFF